MYYYRNISGNSGISAYEIGENYIKVLFNDRMMYCYTDTSAGYRNIETMKKLAIQGNGLNSFINKNVRDRYEFKTRY